MSEQIMEQTTPDRGKSIIKVSIVGIVANALLASFKAIIGILSNSIAIVLDAVNNLSDALSSVITIVGTKLSAKAPNKEHPYGYGRIEYLTTVVIAVIVLWAGATSLKESIDQILHPETPSYTTVSLIIVGVAVAAKIVLGLYVKKSGKKLQSDTLIASGQDALMDSIISASTLAAAAIYLLFDLSLEAWLGAVISIFILKAGYEIIKDATSKLLGERVDGELSKQIKETIRSVPGVHGAYDLILNDYGPQRLWGSVHVELDDTATTSQIDQITRKIQQAVIEKHQVILHTVGVYSYNTDTETAQLRDQIYKLIRKHDDVLEIHGFYRKPETNEITLDVIIGFEAKDRKKLHEQIQKEVSEQFPDYNISIFLDSDISD